MNAANLLVFVATVLVSSTFAIRCYEGTVVSSGAEQIKNLRMQDCRAKYCLILNGIMTREGVDLTVSKMGCGARTYCNGPAYDNTITPEGDDASRGCCAEDLCNESLETLKASIARSSGAKLSAVEPSNGAKLSTITFSSLWLALVKILM
uniref:UPAR/Ly6 domain-containing protein n=1 Tax=Steinernema glaseri TaxID=37863 RepID=A0A1I7ZEJ7_9BILA